MAPTAIFPYFYRIIYLEKPFFSLLQLVRKQENRDYRMESPFQHYYVEVNKV
jgi:hypothetical protein